MYLKDSNGNKSLTTTISVVAFVVVMLKVLFGGGSITVGSFAYSFGDIDAAMIAAIFGPTLGAYVFRRHTAAQEGMHSEKIEAEREPVGRSQGPEGE